MDGSVQGDPTNTPGPGICSNQEGTEMSLGHRTVVTLTVPRPTFNRHVQQFHCLGRGWYALFNPVPLCLTVPL